MGIAICRVPEAKTVKNRVHLDLHTTSVDALVALGAAVAMIASFHQQGGFQLVLTVTAAVTALFLAAAIGVAAIASLASSRGKISPQPAE